MQITANTLASLQTTFEKLGVQRFETLLSLHKLLPNNEAVVKLHTPMKNLDTITLSIKEPLKEGLIYQALLQKEQEGITLKSLLPLPDTKQQLIKAPPHLPLTTLITLLKEGQSPEKILFDTISAQLLQSVAKEEMIKQLDQLLIMLRNDDTLIRVEYGLDKGYVSFKKPKSAFSQKMLEFNAFFLSLGDIHGTITQVENQSRVHMVVQNEPVKMRLESATKQLGMPLSVAVDTNIVAKLPTPKLLDIKA